LYRLDRLLRSKRRYSAEELCRHLECSRATLKRLIAFMRDRQHAPIICDRRDGLYQYDPAHAQQFELPGLWFGPREIVALATLVDMLAALEPGLLREHLDTCRGRLRDLLRGDLDVDRVGRCVRLLSMNRRQVAPDVFNAVTSALVSGRRLAFDFPERDTHARGRRTVSPQRLVRYRDNWYLDAWCHTVDRLRTFGLARMEKVKVLEERSRIVGRRRLERFFAQSYGIYNGPAKATAVIRFTGPAARYAAVEQWHPRQKRTMHADGSVELRFPYGDPTELVKDILSWGECAEVVEPPELRDMVRNKLKNAVLRYEQGPEVRVE